MKTLVTGGAGFIGYHLTKRLLKEGNNIVIIDNMSDYYDVNLKKQRLANLEAYANTRDVSLDFVNASIESKEAVDSLFRRYSPRKVINLAAQAGVRYSLESPGTYIQSNIVGFAHLLEACRHNEVEHLVYASSSSVYGGNENMPFRETDSVDHPVSLYAASKKANELMAHTYSHLFGLPTTGLRFFTVYGPWGRPDMALFLFTKAIIEGKPINVFNEGNMIRDFTYIDDIIESVYRITLKKPDSDESFDRSSPKGGSSWAPYRVFNIGNSSPTPLMNYINAIERELGKKAIKNMLPMQPGDVAATNADTSALEEWVKFKPSTSIEEGVKNFIKWYKEFYKL